MKKHFYARTWLLVLACWLGCLKGKAQRLEIHQLGLGDGDCSLVIAIDSVNNIFMPSTRLDTAVVLIDGQRPYCNKQIIPYVERLLTVLGRQKVDYVVVSHLHYDHYGSIVPVIQGLEAKGIYVGNIYDRSAYSFPVLNSEFSMTPGYSNTDSCFDYDELPQAISASLRRYLDFVVDHNTTIGNGTNHGTKKPKIEYGAASVALGTDLFSLKFSHISMTCVAANGATLDSTGFGRIPFLPESTTPGVYSPHSENDLSLAFLISFQGFHYFTGGDIGGPGVDGNYTDGETPISKYLKKKFGSTFHLCAYKVSHHGSSESTDPNWVNNMNPTLAVIPASLRSYGSSNQALPTKVAIDNLAGNPNGATNIRYTFIPKNPGNPASFYKKDNLDSLQDVDIVINGLPGTGHSITMYMTYQTRGKNRELTGAVFHDSIICTKQH